MASRREHEIVGALAASTIAFTLKDDIDRLMLDISISVPLDIFAGRLPDLIEPSLNNPNHRQFFHSLVFACGIIVAVKHLYLWEPQTPQEKLCRWVLLIMAGGYLSHLALDSSTPKSLPVLGKF